MGEVNHGLTRMNTDQIWIWHHATAFLIRDNPCQSVVDFLSLLRLHSLSSFLPVFRIEDFRPDFDQARQHLEN